MTDEGEGERFSHPTVCFQIVTAQGTMGLFIILVFKKESVPQYYKAGMTPKHSAEHN